MSHRRFSSAIKLLESRSDIYENNFEYYLELGMCCLYLGDMGMAGSYFQSARRLRINDVRLLLGQAAIFLHRSETDRALQYYLEIKDIEPENKIASEAIEFIRLHGDHDTICRWVDTGRLERFYPSLGFNTDKLWSFLIPVAACVLGVCLFFALFPQKKIYGPLREGLTDLQLSDDEKHALKEKDLSTQSFLYILTEKEITKTYSNAILYFQEHRDNAAQVEINRILNSNAAQAVKKKADIISSYLEIPDFDTIRDVPDFSSVKENKLLYKDCWVSWGGKISNALENEDGSYVCDFLVGDEDLKHYEGSVRLLFEAVPNIDTEHYVKILGKLSVEKDIFMIKGRAVYQSVHK